MRFPRLAVAALYVGGLIGPFAGGVVAPMLPELSADFDISLSSAGAALTAYLIPFAALMLVSGTIGERWGRARVIRFAYIAYIGASLLCVLADDYALFLTGRITQGAANAFTTPLLLAAIATATPPERLGRAMGMYGSMQAAGQSFAPLFGGLAAEFSWRYAFIAVACVAAILAAIPLPTTAQSAGREPVRLRAAWRTQVVLAGLLAMVAWATLGGLSFLVATHFADAFGLSSGVRGVLLTGFGIAGLLTSRLVGVAVDRVGARSCALVGSLAAALAIGLFGAVPWLAGAVALWTLAGVGSQLIMVGLNTLVLVEDGPNRGGAVSVVQSFRFIGAAASPLAFLPLYGISAIVGFLVPAVLLAITGPAVLARRPPGSSSAAQ
ncbi:putative MFS family arabinose efflux permease [Tamaricihabitans halophyticus]|uniref:Putative MFS family arabinose efflux permease n=1 Tax=Tamaricihabitans halophyticus TaxID=1262583 RepID=A0A4R2QPJ5_9PSEU|nr:MFS transporter [Tamaricihabitans halophyticus]TCP50859.1 putative MFS family arabinose efflux permease [Tamaricihabitans halophyticus]